MAYLEAEKMVTKGDEGAVKGGRGFEEGVAKGQLVQSKISHEYSSSY